MELEAGVAAAVEALERLVAAGDNSIGSGEECAMQLLARKNRPTAIFAANDDMAAGVIPEMREACPREAGRTADSFSLSSLERPWTPW